MTSLANSSSDSQMSSCVLRPAWLSSTTWSMFEDWNRRSLRRIVSGEPIRPPRSAAACASGLAVFHFWYSSHMLTVPAGGRRRPGAAA